jgi:hypothetical protein
VPVPSPPCCDCAEDSLELVADEPELVSLDDETEPSNPLTGSVAAVASESTVAVIGDSTDESNDPILPVETCDEDVESEAALLVTGESTDASNDPKLLPVELKVLVSVDAVVSTAVLSAGKLCEGLVAVVLLPVGGAT